MVISKSVLSSGKWEPGISLTIYDILSRHADLEAVVLDVGANLGIHGLYAAKLGYRVWAIEPQERNLIKVTFIIRFMFIIAFNEILSMTKRYLVLYFLFSTFSLRCIDQHQNQVFWID